MSTQPGTGTSEVSKKLKAAIRAKLEELGVYVDDELPDYIMVMIANKKERVQMKEDLNLFIGKSTAKFVDWLFDLFDRLQNASNKQGESSSGSAKKDEEKQKEQEAKEQEEKRRKEKEDRERELQKEKEKERERQRERDRAKRLEEEKRREEKRKEASKPKRRRTRSRSNTYSDDERMLQKPTDSRRHQRGRSVERRRPSAISSGDESSSPAKKLQSKVTVHRNIRPTGESSTAVKGRGTMFMRALNEASVSSSGRRKNSQNQEGDDDMSDVEALPSKAAVKSPKKSVHERLSRVKPIANDEDDTVVLGSQPKTGGPQMILKLSGGREAIKKARIQDRIVLPDDGGLRRGLLKRRVEMPGASEEPKSKHERIKFDASRDTTPSDDSPTMQKWNGHIRIGDDSDEEDDIDEAQIDAMVAEARGIPRRNSAMDEEEEIPATHHLSGAAYQMHIDDGYPVTVPTYIPTPLSVLNEQHNQMGGTKDQLTRERCMFWPKCTKKEACQFAHPTTTCKNFPNCTYGNRCLFIHPNCRFDRFCTKKHCPFTHPGTGGYQPGSGAPPSLEITSNRVPVVAASAVAGPGGKEDAQPQKPLVRGALGNLAEKLAASIKKKPVAEDKKEEKTDENEAKDNSEVSPSAKEVSASPPARVLPDFRAPLQSMIPCRYAAACRNPVCHFKHPKECRFGSQCRNHSCYFYHKPASAPTSVPKTTNTTPAPTDATGAKYKWTASANN